METITNRGQLSYRTKLMDLEKAAAFARCLQANDRFTAVEIETSQRTKSDKRHFVTFLPANEERVAEMLGRQQDAREERAATQGFTFCLDKDAGRPFFWCHSHTSGEVYEVTAHSCNCPDHQFRCAANGLRCKHQLALDRAVIAGETISW